MDKRLFLVFIAISGYLPNAGYAQQTVSIVIMPFEVHAKEQLLYLQNQIPEVIAKNLEQEGARVLVLDEPGWALSGPIARKLVETVCWIAGELKEFITQISPLSAAAIISKE